MSPAIPPPAAVPTQADIDKEMRALAGTPGDHPMRGYGPYRSSLLRHPQQPLLRIADPDAVELTGPVFGVTDVTALDADLTQHAVGEPLGERITVTGRVLDRAGRPIRGQLVEVWQANASGRYAHQRDDHPAPLDPNFVGAGRCLTDDDGRYRFTTIKPGAYPWRNHVNAWRPAHIHFSLFGTAFTQRLVTQMYFPGDPLFAYDPILQSVTDASARDRLVAAYDPALSVPETSLGYRWDIVLDGPSATWIEEGAMTGPTPSQTVGPFFGYALPFPGGESIAAPGDPDAVVIRGVVYDGAGAPVPDALVEIWQAAPDGSRRGAFGSMRRDPVDRAVLGRHGLDFTGFARAATDADGHWFVRTLRPGPPSAYLAACVFARGLLHHLFTRIYLPTDAAAVDNDPVLSALPPSRRATLVAIEEAPAVMRFDIRLQGVPDGPEETVFFEFA